MERTVCVCTFIFLQLLCSELLPSSGLPSVASPEVDEKSRQILPGLPLHHRPRRRAGDLDISSGPAEYMRQLYSSLADEEGKPRNAGEDPTSIWCILDKDIQEGSYREKPQSPKCSSVNRFLLGWKSMAEAHQLKPIPVQKGILRAYLQVIPRLLKRGDIPVDITVTARLHNHTGNAVLAGQDRMVVTVDSNGWVELNVTEGLQALWPPRVDSYAIEFTVTLTVDCRGQRKVPARFVDPAEIPLDQDKRRQRHLNLQPILLVYVDDEDVKQKIRAEEAPLLPDSEEMDVMDAPNRTIATQSSGTSKRSTDGSCGIEDFELNFLDLKLDYVLSPYSYNAKKCTGSCSHTFLKRNERLANNHAKIMASAYLIAQKEPTTFRFAPQEPCCVPVRLSSLSLLLQREDYNLEYEVFPSMMVEECGCR